MRALLGSVEHAWRALTAHIPLHKAAVRVIVVVISVLFIFFVFDTEYESVPSLSRSSSPPTPTPTQQHIAPPQGKGGPAKSTAKTPLEVEPSDLTVQETQCKRSFPRMLDDTKRPWNYFTKNMIIDDDINGIDLTEGMMRLSLIDKKIIIHKANLPTIRHRTDALLTLQSLHTAITSTTETYRPIDFVMTVSRHIPDIVNHPVWTFARKATDVQPWMMPTSTFLFDFDPSTASASTISAIEDLAEASQLIVTEGWFSKVEVPGGTRDFVPQPDSKLAALGPTREDLIAQIKAFEATGNFWNKSSKVVTSWPADHPPKGKNTFQNALDNEIFGQDWGVHVDPRDKSSGIQGYGSDLGPQFPGVPENKGEALCRNRYIIHDTSFTSPADTIATDYVNGPALCGSVVFGRKTQWSTLYTRLVDSDPSFDAGSRRSYKPHKDAVVNRWKENKNKGAKMPVQNVVYVRHDMQDVPVKLKALHEMPSIALRIVEAQVKTYRERYMSRAAEACYWRELVRTYGDVYASLKYDVGGEMV